MPMFTEKPENAFGKLGYAVIERLAARSAGKVWHGCSDVTGLNGKVGTVQGLVFVVVAGVVVLVAVVATAVLVDVAFP